MILFYEFYFIIGIIRDLFGILIFLFDVLFFYKVKVKVGWMFLLCY